MKKYIARLFLTFVLSLSSTAQAYEYVDQNEVPQWAGTAIEAVREKRIMTGGTDGHFRPKSPLNRAQAVTILARLEKHREGYEALDVFDDLPFEDIDIDDWFYDAVANAYHKGWVNGRSDTVFEPWGTLSRAEWVTMVVRAFDLEEEVADEVDYRDVPSRAWFTPFVRVAVTNGLVRFPHSHYYGPEKIVTRADAAWLMAQILEKPRLMGTSQESRFASRNPRTMGRGRVAIKPRNFNVHKQGLEVEKKALQLKITPEEEVIITSNPTYHKMGSFEVLNTLDDNATFEDVHLRVRFDNPAIGPEEGFDMKMIEVGTYNEWESQASKRGEVVFAGLGKNLDHGDSIVFEVYLRPRKDMTFFQKSGKGTFYIFKAGGIVSRIFKKSGRAGQRYAPINIKERNFSDVYFDPTK